MIRIWRSRLARQLHATAYRIAPKPAPAPRWLPKAFVAMYVTKGQRAAMPSVWDLAAEYWDAPRDDGHRTRG